MIQPKAMKKIFQALSIKAKSLLETDLATKDRPLPFQVVVITLLLSTVLFISYSIIQAITKI
jgi:hypothetical protein